MTGAQLLPQMLLAGVLFLSGAAELRAPLDVPAGFVALCANGVSGRVVRAVFPWGEKVLGVSVLVFWGWPLAVQVHSRLG